MSSETQQNKPNRMTHYQRLEDNEGLPQYTEARGPEPQYMAHTPLKAEQQENGTYLRELNRCCILISLLNFLCCWWCGIPALIFAILGVESEKRGEVMAARTHGRYMNLFNRLGCMMFFLMIVLYTMYYVIVWCVYAEERQIHMLTTTTEFPPTTTPYNY